MEGSSSDNSIFMEGMVQFSIVVKIIIMFNGYFISDMKYVFSIFSRLSNA